MINLRLRGFCAILLLLLVFCGMTLSVSAEDEITGGSCGSNLTWSLNLTTGEMTISGTGAMGSMGMVPVWTAHRSSIRTLTVEEGVVSIASFAFSYCSNLTSVNLPHGLTEIEKHAFYKCEALTRVMLPSTLREVGVSAFQDVPLELTIYNGTAPDWSVTSVGISTGNQPLTDTLHIHPGHSFSLELVDEAYLASPAGCVTAAKYYKSCVCGEVGTDTFTHGAPLGHRGGTATCTKKAVCTACGTSYGNLAPHNPGPAATCTQDQSCTSCGTVLTKKLGHDYKSTVTPATCTKDGGTTYTCTRCDHSYVTPIPAKEHTPGDAPTCTTDQICTTCHAILEKKLGHNYKSVLIPPTCTATGFAIHTCTRCDHEYKDSHLPATGHTAGLAASCTEDQTCLTCKAVLVGKLGHKYVDTVKLPTCTEEGYTVHTCSRCVSSYTDTPTPPAGHMPSGEATCTTDSVCLVCRELLAKKTGHSYESTVTSPSCTDAGYTTHVCSTCNDLYRDNHVSALGHTPGDPATCTTDQVCTQCSTILAGMMGHAYESKVIPPTCTEGGYTLHSCSRCKDEYTDATIKAKGHSAGKEATCLSDQTCSDCGTILNERLGHDYESTVIPPTCTDDGYTYHTCARCLHSFTDNKVDKTSHTPGDDPTCLTDQLCTVCGIIMSPSLGHDIVTSTVPPTCTEDGHYVHFCSRCATETIGDTIPHLDHVPSDWITDRESSFDTEGIKHIECTVCGAVLDSVTFVDSTGGGENTGAGCDDIVKSVMVICGLLVILLVIWILDPYRRNWILDIFRPHPKQDEMDPDMLENDNMNEEGKNKRDR